MNQSIRFTHFVRDDKFTLDSIKCFEESGLTVNKWFCCRRRNEAHYHYINDNVASLTSDQALNIVRNSADTDVIVLHSLYALPPYITAQIHPSIKVIWFAWGFDLYSNPRPIGPLIPLDAKYLPLTSQVLRSQNANKAIENHLKHWYRSLFDKTYDREIIEQAIARIDYFAGVFQEEYDLLKSRYSFFRAKKIIHDYIHPEEFKKEDIEAPITQHGKNIMLGNSATPHCNHLDILHILKHNLHESKTLIYCPLSYQGSPKYVNKVIQEGNLLFGKQFKPMTDFLPLKEYLKVVDSCGSIVLGQMQQAATCNILSSIWSGVKVFVPKESMNYAHYKEEGETIFAIEDINHILEYELPNEKVLNDRRIIESLYSFRRWKCNLIETIRIISE